MEKFLTAPTRNMKPIAATCLAVAMAAVPIDAAITPYSPDADTAALYSLNNPTGDLSTSSYIDDESTNELDLRSNAGTSPFLGVSGPDGLGTAAIYTGATARTFRFGANDVGAALDFETFTIEAWVQNPTGINPTIFYLQDGGSPQQRVFFRINQSDTLGSALQLVYTNAGGTTTSLTSNRFTLDQDEWYHAAVTYDNQGSATANDSVVNFYLTPESDSDRNSVGASTGAADLKPLAANGQLLEIGKAGGNNELGGNLDELRYSNTVRDSFNLNVIPEPGSMALLGLGGLMLMRRRS